MDLREKAQENLEVAELLCGQGTFSNAVANRAYYAAYQAVTHELLARGITFDGIDYFRHDLLPDKAAQYGVLTGESRLDLAQLRDLRVKADYHDDPVELEEASVAAESAERIVRGLFR